jgi:UMF1 family MFS transporter
MRKKLFIAANTFGSICLLLVFLGADSEMFAYNGFLMILSNVAFGFAVVFYNAYLPLLVAAHPDTAAILEKGGDHTFVNDSISQVSSRISSNGFAIGFSGQFIFLIINFAVLTMFPDDPGFAVRLNVLLAGVWIIVFGGYCFMNLKTRPGPSLPDGENYFTISYKGVAKTLSSAKDLPQLFLFLSAYFIFSDGCSTLSGSAAVFASVELKMAAGDILLGVLLVSIAAIASCVIWFNIEKRLGMPPKYILVANLTILGLMPVYGYFFMTCQWEFYVMCLVFGLQTGSQQAYTRSIYSSNVPEGHEAEYFAFYEVTDKGTAWLGPLVVAAVNNATGEFRPAFFAIGFFFVVGIFVLLFFDPVKALEEKKAFEAKERAMMGGGKVQIGTKSEKGGDGDL